MTAIGYYLQRVRELGLRESVRQATALVADRAAARVGGLYSRYFDVALDEEANQLVERLLRGPQSVRQFKTRTTPQFFLDHEPEFYRKAVETHFPGKREEIINAANQAKGRTFDLLGSGSHRLPDLPWHVD